MHVCRLAVSVRAAAVACVVARLPEVLCGCAAVPRAGSSCCVTTAAHACSASLLAVRVAHVKKDHCSGVSEDEAPGGGDGEPAAYAAAGGPCDSTAALSHRTEAKRVVRTTALAATAACGALRREGIAEAQRVQFTVAQNSGFKLCRCTSTSRGGRRWKRAGRVTRGCCQRARACPSKEARKWSDWNCTPQPPSERRRPRRESRLRTWRGSMHVLSAAATSPELTCVSPRL